MDAPASPLARSGECIPGYTGSDFHVVKPRLHGAKADLDVAQKVKRSSMAQEASSFKSFLRTRWLKPTCYNDLQRCPVS
jgi:hypothetical protein